jgi:hypothetical protein
VSLSTAPAVGAPLKQSLAELRAGHESYAQFVTDLFSDLETLHGRLLQAETQLALQRSQLAELHSPLAEENQQPSHENPEIDPELQTRVAELESERQALEEELEQIRGRAVNMAEIIAGQKRQMTEEHSQWMGELRQLRRILDKQSKWIALQSELGIATPAPGPAPHVGGGFSAEHNTSEDLPFDAPDESVDATSFAQQPVSQLVEAAPKALGNSHDPVLGSVLSQFELLQKDVARRRKQK